MRLAATSLLLLWSAGALAQTPPLTCPAGTELKTESTAGIVSRQYCLDPKSGLKEGPERVWHSNGKLNAEGSNRQGVEDGISRFYDEAGVLMFEVTFVAGESKSGHVTSEGLTAMLGNLETRASMRTLNTRVSLPGGWTIRYDVHSPEELLMPEPRPLDAGDYKAMACDIFAMPFDNPFVVQLRQVDGSGKVQREQQFTREDCATR